MRGKRVFEEGDPGVGCWVAQEGGVAIDVHVPGRGTLVIQALGSGDVLGWSWLVPPRR